MGAGSSTSGSSRMGSSSGSAQGVVVRPNALVNACRPSPLVHRVFDSDKLLVWRLLSASGGLHCVRLEHDLFLGRRRVFVDGRLVARQSVTLLDRGGSHDVTLGSDAELRISVQVIDQGDQFGYALNVNDAPFAKYRAELWKYAALWLVPKCGARAAGEAAAAAVSVMGAVHASGASAAASYASDNLAPDRLPAACFLPRHYSIIVLAHPQLSVLVDGRPVRDLSSAFSADAAESGSRETDATKHRFWLRRMGEEEAKRCAPREEDEWAPTPADDDPRRPTPIRSAPEADDECMEVELTVWMDAGGAAASAAHREAGQLPLHASVPRDKKHGRFRYALRVDGRLMGQAVNPLVSMHDSLTRKEGADEASDAAHSGDSAVQPSDAPAAAASAASSSAAAPTSAAGDAPPSNDVVLPADSTATGLSA